MATKNRTIQQIIEACKAEIGKLKNLPNHWETEAHDTTENELNEDANEHLDEQDIEYLEDYYLKATDEERLLKLIVVLEIKLL